MIVNFYLLINFKVSFTILKRLNVNYRPRTILKRRVKLSGLIKNYTNTSGITLLTKPILSLGFYIR